MSRYTVSYFSHSSDSKMFKFFIVRCVHAIGKKPFPTSMLFITLILGTKFTNRSKKSSSILLIKQKSRLFKNSQGPSDRRSHKWPKISSSFASDSDHSQVYNSRILNFAFIK